MGCRSAIGVILTRAVTKCSSSVVVGEGLEMLRLDMDHGSPRERYIILHMSLGHGLMHQRVDFFNLQPSKHRLLIRWFQSDSKLTDCGIRT